MLSPKTLSAFIDVVLSSTSDTPIAYPSLSAIPPTPPPSRAQLRAARRLERKLRSVDKLNKHLEQANTLANQGRIMNPLYPVKGTPHGRRQHHTCTPHKTAKKPKLPARETSPIRPLALEFDGVAGPSRHSETLEPVPPPSPPPCLSDLGLHFMPDDVDSFSPAHSVLTFLHIPSPARSGSFFSSPAERQPSTSCSERGRVVEWIKVPLHVGIQGNEEADSLGENGRLSSPLLRQSVALAACNIKQSLAPKRGASPPPPP